MTVETVLDLLCCPIDHAKMRIEGNALVSELGRRYRSSASGIPLFAEHCSPEARRQQEHYDRVAATYLDNLTYPHTREYTAYLDRVFLEAIEEASMETIAEICCGHGEAFHLIGNCMRRGVGVDVSLSMLEAGVAAHRDRPVAFVQGDATALPLASGMFDSVFMLGGIHHVNDRLKLFSEIARILRPGGRFYFREPVSDLFLWRWLRAVIYRVSPALDGDTERPLLYSETAPFLHRAGLVLESWRTYGFFGFCIFMNSDVLVFNRLFRFVPGIRRIARLATRVDDWTTRIPPLCRSGLQVVGVAWKPKIAR